MCTFVFEYLLHNHPEFFTTFSEGFKIFHKIKVNNYTQTDNTITENQNVQASIKLGKSQKSISVQTDAVSYYDKFVYL